MANFFKKALNDMKESAKAQHEVDKGQSGGNQSRIQSKVGRGKGNGRSCQEKSRYAIGA